MRLCEVMDNAPYNVAVHKPNTSPLQEFAGNIDSKALLEPRSPTRIT